MTSISKNKKQRWHRQSFQSELNDGSNTAEYFIQGANDSARSQTMVSNFCTRPGNLCEVGNKLIAWNLMFGWYLIYRPVQDEWQGWHRLSFNSELEKRLIYRQLEIGLKCMVGLLPNAYHLRTEMNMKRLLITWKAAENLLIPKVTGGILLT